MAAWPTFFDMVLVNATETSGLGPFTLGAAVGGFQTAASAGIVDGTPVSYKATDGTHWETAHGIVNVSGSVYTLTRGIDTIESSNSNSLVSFGSNVTIGLTEISIDLNSLVSVQPQSFSAAQQAQARVNIGGSIAPTCGRLIYVSATEIAFEVFNGALVMVNGALYQIPGSGVLANNTNVYVGGVSGQNLAASTLYYVYLFDNSGTLTINFSTTGHATYTGAGADVGVEVMVGNTNYTLIGMVQTNASSQFQDDGNNGPNILVASWFNRRTRIAVNETSGTSTITNPSSGGLVEISSSFRPTILNWSGDPIIISCPCLLGNSIAGNATVYNIGLDGASTVLFSPQPRITAQNNNNDLNTASALTAAFPSEGYHFFELLAEVTAGTGSVNAKVMATSII